MAGVRSEATDADIEYFAHVLDSVAFMALDYADRTDSNNFAGCTFEKVLFAVAFWTLGEAKGTGFF